MAPKPANNPDSSGFGAALRSIRVASVWKATVSRAVPTRAVKLPTVGRSSLLGADELIGGKLDAGGDQRIGNDGVAARRHRDRRIGHVDRVDRHQCGQRRQNPQHRDDDETVAARLRLVWLRRGAHKPPPRGSVGGRRLVGAGRRPARVCGHALVGVLRAHAFSGRIDVHQRRRRHRKFLLGDPSRTVTRILRRQ